MYLASLLCVIRATKRYLFFLIRGLLATIPVISAVFAVSPIDHVDLSIVLLLLWGSLATGLKESSPALRCLDACVHDYKQIYHRLGFLYCDLLHSLDVADSVVEGIDDLDVLDVWNSIPSITEMFHVILEALIMLLPDGLESLSHKWALVCALKVSDKHSI
jgi:hypothetical protein